MPSEVRQKREQRARWSLELFLDPMGESFAELCRKTASGIKAATARQSRFDPLTIALTLDIGRPESFAVE